MPRIDPQTAGAARVTHGLEEVLPLVDVVDVHVWQHCDLIARDVRGCGLVAHPNADALAHRVKSTVLRQLSSPAIPLSGAMRAGRWLRVWGVSAEVHPGRQVAAFVE